MRILCEKCDKAMRVQSGSAKIFYNADRYPEVVLCKDCYNEFNEWLYGAEQEKEES